jgi:hypothetical protein
MLVEGVDWELSLVNKDFFNSFPGTTKDDLEQALHASTTSEATLQSNHWIPGMGSTFNGARAIGLTIPGFFPRELSVFIKPTEYYHLAEREFINTQVLRRRGLNVPPAIALIRNGESGLLVNRLLHSVLPLSARDLSYKYHHPSIYTPKDLVTNFVAEIGNMHSKGATHNDLHLGNIGHEFQKTHPPRVIFFDFETGSILSDPDLYRKNSGEQVNTDLALKFYHFEKEAIEDLAMFLVYLKERGLPQRRGELLDHAVQVYLSSRLPSTGPTSSKSLRQSLGNAYNSIQQIIRKNRPIQPNETCA